MAVGCELTAVRDAVPAQVEAALKTAPGVVVGAVVLRSAEPAALVAYVEPSGVDTSLVRAYLVRLLPPFMVPARVRALDALPRLPNGKTNLRELARIANDEEGDEGGSSADAAALAEKVAAYGSLDAFLNPQHRAHLTLTWSRLPRRLPRGVLCMGRG